MKYSIENAKKILSKSIDIYSIKQIGEGNHSQAFLINNNFVAKLPKHKKASNCLITEIKVLKALKDKVLLTIPTVEFEGKFVQDDDIFVFYISKVVKGQKLNKSKFLKLDKKTNRKNAKIIAEFLYRLHSHKEILGAKRKDYCLLHGDFSLNHCLFNDKFEICGIIDFGDSRIGKAMSDFVYLLDDEDEEEFGLEFGKQVLEYYKGITYGD